MKIPLDIIKKDLNQIIAVKIIVTFTNSTKTIPVSLDHITFLCQNNFPVIDIHNNLFDNHTNIQCEITYNTGFLTKYQVKPDVIPTKPASFNTNKYLRINTKCPNPNTTEGKDKCFIDVQESIDKMSFIPDIVFGEKKLIYYTVYGENYIKLFAQSLHSLKQTSKIIDYDILVIADLATQSLINKLDIIKNFNIQYLTVHDPIDGIDASINKLKIYNFDKINEYRKVIFLDCDILVLKDIKNIFDGIITKNKIYVIHNPTVIRGSYTGYYHGLQYNVDIITQKALDLDYNPFNAGQFFFVNSSKMQVHFENMRNFIKSWPALYFFEQSTMNTYGVMAACLDYKFTNNHCTALANASEQPTVKKHTEENILIHFIAPALDGDVKLDFIEKYRNNFIKSN